MYSTKQGDTFDSISYKVYGSSKYMGVLMQENMALRDTYVFDSGIEIETPEIDTDSTENLPAWRK